MSPLVEAAAEESPSSGLTEGGRSEGVFELCMLKKIKEKKLVKVHLGKVVSSKLVAMKINLKVQICQCIFQNIFELNMFIKI